MKKLITTSVLVLFLVCGLKAQTLMTVPQCSQNAVTVMAIPVFDDIVYTFYDGDVTLPQIKIPIEKKPSYLAQVMPQITHITNKLIEQGYQLIAVNDQLTGMWVYYYTKK